MEDPPTKKITRPFSFRDPERWLFRLIMLVGICMLTFGSYFVYDIPSALQDQICKQFNIDPAGVEYGALYSVYSWPNTVLALIGGFLLDRVFGVRVGAIIFCSLCALGMFVFAIGVSISSYWTALGGRFIFGLGGECLSVSQSTYTAKWFKGKELALAFGIALSFSRVGSAINLDTMPKITEASSLSTAMWIGTLICLISFVFAVFLATFDWVGTKYQLDNGTTPPNASNDTISLRDIKDFPLSMWMLVFICVSFYIGVFVFVQEGQDFFRLKWHYDSASADNVLSIVSTFSAIGSPFLGFGVDYVGMSATWVLLACALLCEVHVLLGVSSVTPVVGMFFMGAAYSLCAAALWPCVAIIMPSYQLGTAYGLMTAMQNLGLAVAPLAIGQVLSMSNHNWALIEFIFAMLAVIATCFAAGLLVVDLRNGSKLNSSPLKCLPQRPQNNASLEEKPLLINDEE